MSHRYTIHKRYDTPTENGALPSANRTYVTAYSSSSGQRKPESGIRPTFSVHLENPLTLEANYTTTPARHGRRRLSVDRETRELEADAQPEALFKFLFVIVHRQVQLVEARVCSRKSAFPLGDGLQRERPKAAVVALRLFKTMKTVGQRVTTRKHPCPPSPSEK